MYKSSSSAAASSLLRAAGARYFPNRNPTSPSLINHNNRSLASSSARLFFSSMNKLDSDTSKINPLVPVDLVIDDSVQVDVTRSENAVQANTELEFQRKKERFSFLKYLKNMTMEPPGPTVKDAYCLLNLGDSITTEHISPAGIIRKDSPAAKFLLDHGVERKNFNYYGSHRGNDEVMARGTFADIRIVNKLLNGEFGPKTVHVPTGDKLSVFDAAMRYKDAGHDTIILAGAEYGSGSSRDWAAKGTKLLGVKAVIAKSFERIHSNNLVRKGIVPLCFKSGEDADTIGLTGHERYTIDLPNKLRDIRPGQDVTVRTDNGKSFTCKLRFYIQDSKYVRMGIGAAYIFFIILHCVEMTFFERGGLPYAISILIKQ